MAQRRKKLKPGQVYSKKRDKAFPDMKSAMSDTQKNIRKMLEPLKQFDSKELVVGLPASTGKYKDGTSIIEAGFQNEFGTDRIPERSFLRSTMTEQIDKYVDMLKKITARIASGEDKDDGKLALIAQAMEDDVKAKIATGNFEPNAPSTIKAKGSSRPLIDTGVMRRSIRGLVRRT